MGTSLARLIRTHSHFIPHSAEEEADEAVGAAEAGLVRTLPRSGPQMARAVSHEDFVRAIAAFRATQPPRAEALPH